MLDPKSIEAEHPLVHLELFDIELAHEFDNLDRLEGQRVLLFFRIPAMQVWRNVLTARMRLFRRNFLLRIVEHLYDLGEQVRPEALEYLV